jgi:hypothetical protein
VLYSSLSEVYVEIVNLRPGEATWESRGPYVGKGRKCDVESWHLQGCIPHLCRLRTDGLAPRANIECTNHMLVMWT